MCDRGYIYYAHNTGGRVLGGCNQSREQQLREVEVTLWESSLVNPSPPSWLVRKGRLSRTKNVRSELPIVSLLGQRLHCWKYESAVERHV